MTRTVADAAAELQAIAGKDPEDPATDGAPATVPNYVAALSDDRAAGQADRRHQTSRQRAQYVAAVAAVQALGATTVRSPRRARPAPGDILTPEFKRDLNAYLSRLPASAPMKSLADIIAYNDRARRRGAQVRPDAADREPGHEPQRPGAERRVRDRARHGPDERAQRDRHRADDQHARRDPDAERHPDRPRRPRRLPADRRPRGLRRERSPTGRDRVQRHGLQRGEAARVRLRVRAGDEPAPDAERDQPRRLALLRRRPALLPARQGGRHRRRGSTSRSRPRRCRNCRPS